MSGIIDAVIPELLEVGAGCRFRTIAAALNYIDARPAYDLVDTTGITCNTIATSRLVQYFGGSPSNVRPGDLLYLDNDAQPYTGAGGEYAEHWYPIINTAESTSHLRMMIPPLGGTQVGIPLVVYRPRKYIIRLFGDLDIPAQKIKDGIDVSFDGAAAFLNGSGGALLNQRHGFTRMNNVRASGTFITADGTEFAFPNNGDGTGVLSITGSQLYSAAGQMLAGSNFAMIDIRGLRVIAPGDHGISLSADELRITDIYSHVYDPVVEGILCYQPPYRSTNAREKKLSNVTIYREPGNIAQNLGLLNLAGSTQGAVEYHVEGLRIDDNNAHATAAAVKVGGGGAFATTAHLSGIIDASSGDDLETVDATAVIYGRGLRDSAGAALTETGPGTYTSIY